MLGEEFVSSKIGKVRRNACSAASAVEAISSASRFRSWIIAKAELHTASKCCEASVRLACCPAIRGLGAGNENQPRRSMWRNYPATISAFNRPGVRWGVRTGSAMPSGLIANTASASGNEGESTTRQILWFPRPFRRDSLGLVWRRRTVLLRHERQYFHR